MNSGSRPLWSGRSGPTTTARPCRACAAASLLLFALFALQSVSALALGRGVIPPIWVASAAVLALLLASRHPRFHAVWQPAVVASFCLIAWLLLGSVTRQAPPPDVGRGPADGAFRANTLLLNEMQIVIVGFALTRLRFVWSALGTLTVAALTVAVAARSAAVPFALFIGGTGIFVMPSLAALMFVAYLQERGARAEFLAVYELDRERSDERRKRERTEGMLRVLGQAIGGIVHDLGNPLTSVRTGAETLARFGRRGGGQRSRGGGSWTSSRTGRRCWTICASRCWNRRAFWKASRSRSSARRSRSVTSSRRAPSTRSRSSRAAERSRQWATTWKSGRTG